MTHVVGIVTAFSLFVVNASHTISFPSCFDETQGCQVTKLDPLLSLGCAGVEGRAWGAIQGKEGLKFCSAA